MATGRDTLRHRLTDWDIRKSEDTAKNRKWRSGENGKYIIFGMPLGDKRRYDSGCASGFGGRSGGAYEGPEKSPGAGLSGRNQPGGQSRAGRLRF